MEREVLLTGRLSSPAAWRVLRAGPLTAFLDGADLRRLRIGGLELIDQIFVAFRDARWNTLPPQLRDVEVRQGPDSFVVSFHARHVHGDTDFEWQGRIEGSPEGRVSYLMDGVAGSSFDYNRIGLNVLHRADLVVGRAYRSGGAMDPPAADFEATLSPRIAPQAIVDDQLSGMFPPLRWQEIDLSEQATLRLDFEGQDFEPEDQRNFGDSTFKTYATPVSRPRPFRATEGDRLRQSVRVALRGSALPADAPDRPVVVSVASGGGSRLPALGLGCASDGLPLTAAERERIAVLHPAHLRLAVRAGAPEGPASLAVAVADAVALGCRLDVELDLGRETDAALSWAAANLAPYAAVLGTILVRAPSALAFDSGPPGPVLVEARERLGRALPGVAIGVASNFLVALHRSTATAEEMVVASFSVSPAVHRADDATIMENAIGLGREVAEARADVAGGPVIVGPVTLATIAGPYPDGPAGPADLPPQVDARQPSLLAAAWTVGALAELATAAPSAITWFETAGWRGVLERSQGSAQPELFRSIAGAVFPIWHVLADAAEWRDGELAAVSVSRPRDVAALAVHDAGGEHVLLANLTREHASIRLAGRAQASSRVRRLNAATAEMAMTQPEAWRASFEAMTGAVDGTVTIELDAYEVVRVDQEGGRA